MPQICFHPGTTDRVERGDPQNQKVKGGKWGIGSEEDSKSPCVAKIVRRVAEKLPV